MFRSVSVLTLVLALVAIPASAAVAIPAPSMVTLSFASDDNHDGPTFLGLSGGALVDGSGSSVNGVVNVDLMVDKNGDNTGGVTVIPSFFYFSGSISNFTTAPRGLGFVIQWDVTGSFVFVEAATGSTLLTVSFNNALLTTFTPNAFTLGQTASLQTSDDVDPGIVMSSTLRFSTLTGVPASVFSSSEDFAFTFTNLQATSGAGGTNGLPRIDHGVFLESWKSEGSFSAHAGKLTPSTTGEVDPDQ